jgi:hypothetical protein
MKYVDIHVTVAFRVAVHDEYLAGDIEPPGESVASHIATSRYRIPGVPGLTSIRHVRTVLIASDVEHLLNG